MSETTQAGIRRKDISEDQPTLKAFQDEQLVKGVDWWKEGVVIFWTTEATERFRAMRGETLPEPEPIAEGATVHELKVVKLARNNLFVCCASPHEEGCCVNVRLTKRGSGKRYLGKLIRVEQTGESYRQIR